MLMGPATRKTSRMATVLGRHHVSKLYHMVSEDALTRSSMKEALELGTATPLPGPKSKTCCRVTLVLTFCTTRLVTFMCAGAMHTRLSLAGTNVPSMNSEKSLKIGTIKELLLWTRFRLFSPCKTLPEL